MKRVVLYGLLVMLLMGICLFGIRAYGEAKAYEASTQRLVAQMAPEKVASYRAKEWAERLSLGFYKNKQREEMARIAKEGERHRAKSIHYTLYAMGLLALLLGFYFLVSLRAFTFFGAAVAGIMLFFGLMTPILMVTIHKEVAYLGDVVLSFESKSVIGSIAKLFGNGDGIVASVILLFSVLIPFVKTVALMVVALFMQSRFAHGVVAFFKMIGKWSMVDVFVVATFLVYLTVDKGEVSRAEAEVGLYFFLAYVIISMLVSLSADKMLHGGKEKH